jgi:hypothetical protein
MFPDTRLRVVAGGTALLALALMPAPLLPPHRIAELMQSFLQVDWKIAYLFTAILFQSLFYASIGVLAALAVNRTGSPHGRVLQLVLFPFVVITVALCIRSLKAGHLPVWPPGPIRRTPTHSSPSPQPCLPLWETSRPSAAANPF